MINFKFEKMTRAACVLALLLAVAFGSSAAVAEVYTYDAQGRLASVTSDAGVITYYCYDAAGNRTYVGPSACA